MPSLLADLMALFPKLVVFDLDFTLWDCGGSWIDCTRPPFRLVDGAIRDRDGRHFRLYPDVPAILEELGSHASEPQLALASRTQEPEWAREVLELMAIRDRFHHQEIYPSSKVRHFRALQAQTGFAFEQMLFFDDEYRNIDEVGALGVPSIEVRSGLDLATWEAGLDRFRQSHIHR